MQTEEAIKQVVKELERAQSRFAPFQSAHEGHAVIREEFEEHWNEIKSIKWDEPTSEWRMESLKTESIQLAAMALRFIVDILLWVRSWKRCSISWHVRGGTNAFTRHST